MSATPTSAKDGSAKDGSSKANSPSALSPSDTPFGQFNNPPMGMHARLVSGGESRDRRASSVSFQPGAQMTAFMGMGTPTTPRTSNVGLGHSPGSSHLAPNHKPNLNVYRNTRDTYYKHFEVSGSEQADTPSPRRVGGEVACEARCHQLASAALALSYLLADLRDTKGRIPTMRVTYEDIIVALKLPLQYATHNHLTFHQLHCIIKRFVNQDERLKDNYEVIATTFDTRRTDGSVAGLTLVEEETGRRGSVMTATELRSTISDDGLTFDRVKIACYDAEIVAAENVIEVEESELEHNELLCNVIGDGVRAVGNEKDDAHRRPSTHSGCSVVADIQRSKNEVHLLQVHSIEPLKVRRVDVPLKTLHDALSARNPDSQRAQGIIEIRKKDSLPDITSEGTLGVSIGIEGPSHLQKMLFDSNGQPRPAAKEIESMYGMDWPSKSLWDQATSPALEFYDFTIGEHVLTTAVALHLLNATKFPRVDVNHIVTSLKLPATTVRSGGALHILQWYSMLQTLGEQQKFHASFLPLSRHIRKPGSTPFVSVGALSEFLKQSVAMNSDKDKSRAVVMVSFHGGKARNSLNYFRDQENTISYAIIAGFDAESDTALLIDCDVKRNELHWSISVDELHAAMTDHGLLVLCEAELEKKIDEMLPALDAFGESQRKMAKYQALALPSVSVVDTLSIPAPLALCALALQRIGKSSFTSVDEMLHRAPCNFSHALFPHPSLFDVARFFNAIHATQDDIVAYYHSLSVDRTLKKKTSSPAFATLLKTLLDDGAQVLVHFSRFMLANSPRWEGQPCPNYALIVALAPNDTLVLCDTNESPENRLFQASVHDVFKACEDVCAVSRRPRGFVVIAHDPLKAKTIRTERSRFPNLHFSTLTCHSFRSAGPPQIVAAAMAITALGHPTRPSTIYYAAVEGATGDDDACARTLRPLARVRRTLTLPALVEATNRYFKAAKLPLEASVCVGSSRQGHLTRDDLKPILKHHDLVEPHAGSTPIKKKDEAADQEVYVCVYDAKQAHDIAGEFCGAGVILGHDDATSEVVVLNAEPSTMGEVWRSTVTSALECLVKDPEDVDREHFGVMKISQVGLADDTKNKHAST